MPPLDAPLKILILAFSRAFAEWLLGRAVQQVHPLNVELPASTSRSDLLFEVIQANGQQVLLHIEQQGRRSHEPMPWRMLDYMSRLARRELGDQTPQDRVRLQSVVIYTGVGAGAADPGHYEVLDAGNKPSLSWRYKPLLLWQMEAEEVLKLDEPAFLLLVGQTRLAEPERVWPEVLNRIRRVLNEGERGRLLTALTSLMNSEEALVMVERMLDAAEESLLDTPYLRRIRRQGWEEGLLEGLVKGKEEGVAEGLVKGKEEGLTEGLVQGLARGKEEGLAEGIARGKAEGLEVGVLTGLREAILEAIALRFNPLAQEYRQVNRDLEDINDRKVLQRLLTAAIQAETMTDFRATLTQELASTPRRK